MKLLPFDLIKAQSGHPWGTRDGRKGKKIFDTEREGKFSSYYRLFAVLENEEDFLYNIDGRYEEDESDRDLFLYEKSKKGWVVFYRDCLLGFMAIRCLDEIGRLENESIRKADGTYLQTVEVEY